MFKILATILSAGFLFIITLFDGETAPVTVEAHTQELFSPEGEFTVTLIVNKNNLTGFARLQQYLPAGCTAEAIETNEGDFLFEENNAKFIWVELPQEPSFTVSYKVKVPSTMQGLQIINGIFIYIEDDQTKKFAIPPLEINAGNSIVNSLESKVERKLVSVVPEKGQYRVELTIHPGVYAGPATFTDAIPEDFSATPLDLHGAKFSFENQSAIFSWENLPKGNAFTVSYEVNSASRNAIPVISGSMVFGEPVNEIKEEEQENSAPALAESAPAAINSPAPAEKRIKMNNGISYSVQISATMKSSTKDSKYFRKKHSINHPVELTFHEGWKKYLIGTFDGYEDAVAFRNKTREHISDAFVVAYDNGTRIPLSEAGRNRALNQ
jgi:hypothetical protein